MDEPTPKEAHEYVRLILRLAPVNADTRDKCELSMAVLKKLIPDEDD